MLALHMRSQDPSPSRQTQDSYTSSLHRESSPPTSELRNQVAMLSIKPPTGPSPDKRPKLSLQTAIPPSPIAQRASTTLNLPASTTQSPTVQNTYANKFEAPPPPPSAVSPPHISFPSSFNASAPASSGHSPFPHDAPYILSIGTHSILRNSPLPKRHLSATSARAPRRMFSPVKRVAFQEKLVELVPTPSIEASPDDSEAEAEADLPSTDAEHQRRREVIEAEDGHATAVQGRRKRRREWIWRPMEDDVLALHDVRTPTDGMDMPLSAKSPAMSVIDNSDFGLGRPQTVEQDATIRTKQ